LKKTIILFLTSKPYDGGKYQYSLALVEALSYYDKKKYKIIFFYFGDHWLEFVDKYDNVRIPSNSLFVRTIKKIVFFSNKKLGYKIWKFLGYYIDKVQVKIKKANPDLIIFASKDLICLEVKFAFAIPIFDLMHKYEKFDEISNIKIYEDRETYYKEICKNAKIIFVDSLVGKKQVIDNYSIRNNDIIKVLYYIPPSYIRTNFVNPKEIYKSKNQFFYPAQFWSHKNHEVIIYAVDYLKKNSIDVKVVFAGSKKNNYNKIKDLINELNLNENIQILDYVSNDDIISLYKNSLSLIMSTFCGPTNIPPTEAIHLGCPVIVSNVYAAKEQLEDSALFFDPHDYMSLSKSMKSMIDNPIIVSELIQKGINIKKKFSITNFSNSIFNSIDNYFEHEN
jgi:glycosyltransferase involved in cell wall biosynthesis